jgi:hypothetical protein
MQRNPIQVAARLALTATLAASAAVAEGWVDKTIAPVTNPLFFEPAQIQNEFRPIFAMHRTDPEFLGVPADVRVYAAQLRWAVTDRLAIIATKDGYMEIDPEGPTKLKGWNDLAAGLKYAVIKDDANDFILTPGVTFTLPTGNREIFQGVGSGEVNIFASAVKGFGDFHLTANAGFRVPFDGDEGTTNVRYSFMADYYVCQWFIPFVTFNAFTTLTDGERVPFDSEGFDVINFGSANASGNTQGAFGVGFRSRLHERVDLGASFEWGVIDGEDIFRDRLTVDLIWRF